MNPEKIKGFYASEFVPPEIYARFGANSSWWFINPKVIAVCALLKEKLNASVIINNWKVGGQFKYRGYRPRAYNGGGENSQHRLGNAADVNVAGYTSDEVYQHIMDNKGVYLMLGLTTLEDKNDTQGWTHIDCRPTGMDDILIVKPV